jgi:pimeloyl-ACP methyl ester carboxylesterase
MTTTKSANESTVTVGSAKVQMFSGGSGPPLLFLHGGEGLATFKPYDGPLAQRFTVYAPSHPGFNGTPRPPWVSTITDVAHFTLELAQSLGLANYVLMGHSMGGWIAAEMAAMCQDKLRGLVLVDAAGIKPEKAEIAEMFMVSAATRLKRVFYDINQVPNKEWFTRELTPAEANQAHANSEMLSRLCWKPYLHNPSLPHYLRKVNVRTLVVWGAQDAVVPLECGELFVKHLPNATLKTIDRCGHRPQIEKPQEFQKVASEFLSGLK